MRRICQKQQEYVKAFSIISICQDLFYFVNIYSKNDSTVYMSNIHGGLYGRVVQVVHLLYLESFIQHWDCESNPFGLFQ